MANAKFQKRTGTLHNPFELWGNNLLHQEKDTDETTSEFFHRRAQESKKARFKRRVN